MSPRSDRARICRRAVVSLVVALAICGAFMSVPAQAAPTFPDVPPTHPYYDAIEGMTALGVINGLPDGTFRPYSAVTRAQLAALVVRAFALPELNPTVPTFPDVPRNNVFYRYIESAVAAGTISGYPDGTYRPYQYATRATLITAVATWVESVQPAALVRPPADWISVIQCSDPQYELSLRKSEYSGLLNGLAGMGPAWGCLEPATRGEVCQVLWTTLQLVAADPERLRAITGTVTSDAGQPAPGIQVEAVDETGHRVASFATNALGEYRLAGLRSGEYRLRTSNSMGFADEWYDGVGIDSDPEGADASPVNVMEADQPGIDFSLAAVDVTPPDTFLSPPPGRFWGLDTFRILWGYADDYGCNRAQYKVDDGPVETTAFGYIYPQVELADGVHQIEAAAIDYVGNVDPSPAAIEVTVDTTASLLSWDEPADDATLTGRAVTFSGSATDATAGIARVEVEVSQGVYHYLRSTLMDEYEDIHSYIYPLASTWSLELTLAAGEWQVRARSADAAGNLSAWSDSRTFTVEVTDTELPVTNFKPLLFPWMEELRLDGASRDDSGLESVSYSLDDGSNWLPADEHSRDMDGTVFWYIYHPGLEDGRYDVLARSVDLSGTIGASAMMSVIIDRTAPELTWAMTTNGQILTIAGTLDDGEGSGAAGVLVTLVTLDEGGFVGRQVADITMDDDTDIHDYVYPGVSTFARDFTLPGGETHITVWPHDAAGHFGQAYIKTITLPASDLDLEGGWNLVAGGAGSDFLGVALFKYTGKSYVSITARELGAGAGYWCKMAGAKTAHMTLTEAPVTVALSAGWNLIGNSSGQSLALPTERMAFTYDPVGRTYSSATVLESGQGAWIQAAAASNITLEPVP